MSDIEVLLLIFLEIVNTLKIKNNLIFRSEFESASYPLKIKIKSHQSLTFYFYDLSNITSNFIVRNRNFSDETTELGCGRMEANTRVFEKSSERKLKT